MSVVVVRGNLLLANMNIPSTNVWDKARCRAPVRAVGLLIPANLMVFQVPSGEEALLATQMISPQLPHAGKRLTTPGFHIHHCK